MAVWMWVCGQYSVLGHLSLGGNFLWTEYGYKSSRCVIYMDMCLTRPCDLGVFVCKC